MTTRVTEGARRAEAALVSRVSPLRRSTLAHVCTPLTKAEEKERLLAVYRRVSLEAYCFLLGKENPFFLDSYPSSGHLILRT